MEYNKHQVRFALMVVQKTSGALKGGIKQVPVVMTSKTYLLPLSEAKDPRSI
jgi:hypothetical protein